MQIKVKAKLYAPISYGGPRARLLWTKNLQLELTPKILSDLLDGKITIDKKLVFSLKSNGHDMAGYSKRQNVLTISRHTISKDSPDFLEHFNFLKQNGWVPTIEARRKYSILVS